MRYCNLWKVSEVGQGLPHANVRERMRYDRLVVFPNKTMPSKTPTDKLLPSLAAWDLADLRELQAALGGLIEALEMSQKTPEPESDGDGDREESGPRSPQGSRGHIEAKYIPRGNKRHGPYLYLRYWQGGKLRSKYLGKAPQGS